MGRGYVDTEVGQIHYQEMGSGEPFLLFHKTPSNSTHYQRVMPLFAEAGYRVVAMDSPGYGMSQSLLVPPDSMTPYKKAALGLMDHLGIEKANMLGTSTGGSIALEIAGNHPERADKLVIAVCGSCETQEDRDRIYAGFRAARAEFGQEMEWSDLDARGDYVENFIVPWMRHHDRIGDVDDPEAFLVETIAALQSLPHYWWTIDAVFTPPGAYAYFPTLEHPVLFVNPTGSRAYNNTKGAHRRVKGSKYVEIDASNDFALLHPEMFARIVLDFFSETASQREG